MSLIPRWYNKLPSMLSNKKRESMFNLGNFFDQFEAEFEALSSHPTGLSVFSDANAIYVEAQVPGLTAKDITVFIDKDHCLWIKGSRKEEIKGKGKKYYKKAESTFSYCVPLWQEIDEGVEPEATCKNGVMRLKFARKDEKLVEAKKINVKEVR